MPKEEKTTRFRAKGKTGLFLEYNPYLLHECEQIEEKLRKRRRWFSRQYPHQQVPIEPLPGQDGRNLSSFLPSPSTE